MDTPTPPPAPRGPNPTPPSPSPSPSPSSSPSPSGPNRSNPTPPHPKPPSGPNLPQNMKDSKSSGDNKLGQNLIAAKAENLKNSKHVVSRSLGDVADAADRSKGSDLNRITRAKGLSNKSRAIAGATGAAISTSLTGNATLGRAIGHLAYRFKKLATIQIIAIFAVPFVAIILVVALFFGVISTITGLGGAGSSGASSSLLKSKKDQPRVNSQIIKEFIKAGSATGVPWTIIAAIAATSTNFGKFSPYDSIDRAPKYEGVSRNSNAATNSSVVIAGKAFPVPEQVSVYASEGITDGFGAPRPKGSCGPGCSTHQGQDIMAPQGSTVVAIESGKLTAKKDSQPSRGCSNPEAAIGLTLSLVGDSGAYYFMDHLTRYEGITNGETKQVSAGQVIGYVGNTGDACATAPHLHIELHPTGRGSAAISIYPSLKSLAGATTSSNLPTTSGQAAGTSTNFSSPTSPTNPTNLRVKIVGDSLCEGYAGNILVEKLKETGYSSDIDCYRGRTITPALEIISATDPTSYDILIVSVGANDAVAGDSTAFTAGIDSVMAAASPHPVIWLDVASSPTPGVQSINEAIYAASSRYINFTALRFSDVIGDNVSYRSSDKIHLTAAGYKARAAAIASVLTEVSGQMVGAPAGTASNPSGVKVSNYPIIEPPIGDASKPAQGPFLIKTRYSKSGGESGGKGINLQNFKAISPVRNPVTATDFISSELYKIKKSLKNSNLVFSTRESFWQEAIRRLPIVDPRKLNCGIDPSIITSTEEVVRSIRDAWSCNLEKQSSITTLTNNTITNQKYSDTLEGTDQITTLVEEAILVAQKYSNFGQANCDPGAELAGVFPLTKEVFNKYAEPTTVSRGRCDKASNVYAAAQAFAATESVPPGIQGSVPATLDLSSMIFPFAGPDVTITDTFDDPQDAGTGNSSPGTTTISPPLNQTSTSLSSVLAIQAGTITFTSNLAQGNVGRSALTLLSSNPNNMPSTSYTYTGLVLDPTLKSGQAVSLGQSLGTATNGPVTLLATQAGLPVNLYTSLLTLASKPLPVEITSSSGKIGDRTTALGPYAPLVGGWWAMPWVLGDSSAREKTLTLGPYQSDVPVGGWNSCLVAVDSFIVAGLGTAGISSLSPCGTLTPAIRNTIKSRSEELTSYIESFPLVDWSSTDKRIQKQGTLTNGSGGAGASLPPPTRPFTFIESGTNQISMDTRDAYSRLASIATEAVKLDESQLPEEGDADKSLGSIIPRLNIAATDKSSKIDLFLPDEDYAAIVLKVARDFGPAWAGDRKYAIYDQQPAGPPDAFNNLSKYFGSTSKTNGSVGAVGSEIPYAAEFNKAAEKYNDTKLDPRMLAAVAFVESGFSLDVMNCTRGSSAGAQGIMQFMPATARGFNIDPCKPAEAIDAAANYLTSLYTAFNNNWELAWAAYNAGAGAVRKYNGVPPYPETQNYVKKIRSKWEEYKIQFPNTNISSNSTSGPAVEKAIAWAQQHLGKPYNNTNPARFGPDAFDCSGLIYMAYKNAGIAIPTVSGPQYAALPHVPLEDMQRGDLIFWGTAGKDHVAMYLGGGRIIQSGRGGVKEMAVWGSTVGAARVVSG